MCSSVTASAWTYGAYGGWLYSILLMGFLCLQPIAHAFVLMGPSTPNETANAAAWNYSDELGAPKTIDREYKRFFRWNIPHFVYSFDASFANYFGTEGMDAVDEAMGVLNDFFVNEDYQGMSQLNLTKHGFAGNHNTSWINDTAQNAQIIDIKSLTLGMMVNHLGLGNPHRHAFSIANITTNATTNILNVHVALRNYDPVSTKATDVINGVQYSYRMVHDQPIQIGVTPPTFGIADMEEFTTDSTGNAWSSVAGIVDAFYGNTALFWTDTPSLFNFGVYYDGYNAMGGQFQPRHALTYDDAGGLKYLYSKENYAHDILDAGVYIIENPRFVPEHMRTLYEPNSINSHSKHMFWPRRGNNGIWPANASFGNPYLGTWGMGWVWMGNPQPTNTRGGFLAAGIDIVQMHHQPFDSLLGVNFTSTNFSWNYNMLASQPSNNVTWISDAKGRKIGRMDTKTKGIQWLELNPDVNGAQFWLDPVIALEPLSEVVGRTVAEPDFLFVADNLPTAPDGVPVGFARDIPLPNITDMNYMLTGVGATNEPGPGMFTIPAASSANAGGMLGGNVNSKFAFAFNKIGGHLENFEVLWSGEASLTGHQEGVPTMWGHIKGPGPRDVATFPKESTQDRIWNSVLPDISPPVISMISDSAGDAPIEANTLTRTEETITIIGTEMASVTAIEIVSGDLVLQTIMPVDKYIVSNSRIDIPPGIITDAAEGAARQMRVWNSVGASEKSTQSFTIETGRPVITGTSSDNFVFDRAQTLTVYGYGFKSKTAGQTRIDRLRVDDANSASVEDNGTSYNLAANGVPFIMENIQTLSDTQIVLPIGALTEDADGSNRRLRVARKGPTTAADVNSVLSPATNPLFTAITTKPVISTLAQFNSSSAWELMSTTGMYKRDRILEINGTALNTTTTIEITQEDGTSFPNPVFIQMPNAAVAVEDNGTRMQVAVDAIPWPDADNNSSSKRAFKIYNAVGSSDLIATQTFVVNTQPVIDGIGGFAVAGHFNRDKTVGDDLTIFGAGLLSVKNIILTDHNDTSQNRVTIALPAPGITVSDNSIKVNTATFQMSSDADTDLNSSARIIKLESARDNATSSVAQRFKIGAPPIITAISGIGGIGTDGNYSRAADTLTLTGTGFGHMAQLEIVDVNGNPIAGVPGIFSGSDGTGGTGLNISSATDVSVDPSATGWITTTHLIDSAVAASRRVKITTPFGSATTWNNATGAFRIGATPAVLNTAQATFAGGGYDGGTNTYDNSDGDLIINGNNFRSVTRIVYGPSLAIIIIDPSNPPLGYTFSADGTKITVAKANVPAAWIGNPFDSIHIHGIDGLLVSTQNITTQE